jgi:hypothetical protein
MKRYTIYILFILIFSVFAAGCSGNANEQPATQATNQPAASPAVTTPAPTPTDYKIGDRVVVGDRAYTVSNIKTTAFVGDEYTKKEATGIYVLVSMNIENIGKESATMTSNDVKIIDEQGRTFESDTNAWIALKDNILLKQIQPGLPVKGETIFDVPKGIDAKLQVTDGGWTTKPVNITLGKIQ